MNPEVLLAPIPHLKTGEGPQLPGPSELSRSSSPCPSPPGGLDPRLPAQPSWLSQPWGLLGSLPARTRLQAPAGQTWLSGQLLAFPYPPLTLLAPDGPGPLGNIQTSSSLQGPRPIHHGTATLRPDLLAAHSQPPHVFPASSPWSRWRAWEAPTPPFPAREDRAATQGHTGCWEGRPVGSDASAVRCVDIASVCTVGLRAAPEGPSEGQQVGSPAEHRARNSVGVSAPCSRLTCTPDADGGSHLSQGGPGPRGPGSQPGQALGGPLQPEWAGPCPSGARGRAGLEAGTALSHEASSGPKARPELTAEGSLLWSRFSANAETLCSLLEGSLPGRSPHPQHNRQEGPRMLRAVLGPGPRSRRTCSRRQPSPRRSKAQARPAGRRPGPAWRAHGGRGEAGPLHVGQARHSGRRRPGPRQQGEAGPAPVGQAWPQAHLGAQGWVKPTVPQAGKAAGSSS